VSESETLSVRIRRTIPTGILRIPAFLLFNGTAGGLVWILLLLLGTVIVTMTGLNGSYEESIPFMLSLFFYIYAYVLTIHLIWQVLLRKFIRKSLIYLLSIFAMLFGMLLPLVVDLLINKRPTSSFGAWGVFNVFALFSDIDNRVMIESHLLAASAWAFCITLMHLPYFLKNFVQFKRSPRTDNR